jgi:endonuclease/exonuclease/phosphatase family metal-dependent hydrolase
MKVISGMLIVPVVLICIFLIYITVADYRPQERETIKIRNNAISLPSIKKEFSFLTWNVGYSGLGKDMDFFYEGGKRVRPLKTEFSNYLQGIKTFLSTMDSVDFIFIQEADVHSKRSYYTDEVTEFEKVLPQRCALFAKNYDSKFVPLPLGEPMGRVVSGILSLTKYRPDSALRIDYGTRFSWPKQLALLKRCFMVMRYHLSKDKDLVIVNLHNSTFDTDGGLRKKELKKLNAFAQSEFSKGNYVIIGGDWNNNPRGFNFASIISGDIAKAVEPPIDSTFLRGWRFAFDGVAPSNRDVDMPYQKGKTKTTIIDFYVVSPNINIDLVHTLFTGFSFSDHQPVFMKVTLK